MDCSMLLRTCESFISMSRAPANFGFPIFRAPSDPSMRKSVRHSAGGASGMKDAWVVEMRFSSIRRWHVRTPSADYVLFFLYSFLLPLTSSSNLRKPCCWPLLFSVTFGPAWPSAVGRIFRLASSQPTTLGGGRAREPCDLLLRRGKRDRIFLEFRAFFWGNSRAVFVRC